MTFAEEVIRDALAAGLPRDIAERIAEEVTKPKQAHDRVEEIRQQQKILRMVGAPGLLGPFAAARLSLDEVKAAVHNRLKRGWLNTKAIESLREDAAAGRLKRPDPVAAAAPPPTLEQIGAEVYARRTP